mgnify:CR=1 FL=1
MNVDAFDFDLPEDRIALRPASPRDAARMLVVRPGRAVEHAVVRDLPRYLSCGDVLTVNDTKVIAARLAGRRLARPGFLGAGAKIEATLIRREAPDVFAAFAKPAKRLAVGDKLVLGRDMAAEVVEMRAAGEVVFRFALAGPALDAAVAIEGDMPLPPYIAGKRKPDVKDRDDYQTVYAAHEGAVASPTAGLHFTPELFARLEKAGIKRETLTLHVGAGTFLPVSVADTADHKMHSEWASLSAETAARLNAARKAGGRIVSVGTTSLRTLESAATDDGVIHPFQGETDIFITPGYRFNSAEVLLTNFHLPRSTLFMLVSALIGHETQKRAYAHAIKEGYRFYSYGDACLLLPETAP